MKYSDLNKILMVDLQRYCGKTTIRLFLKYFILHPGFKFTFWLRVSNYLNSKGKLAIPLYLISRVFHRHYEYKFGIQIPFNTKIGKDSI